MACILLAKEEFWQRGQNRSLIHAKQNILCVLAAEHGNCCCPRKGALLHLYDMMMLPFCTFAIVQQGAISWGGVGGEYECMLIVTAMHSDCNLLLSSVTLIAVSL